MVLRDNFDIKVYHKVFLPGSPTGKEHK